MMPSEVERNEKIMHRMQNKLNFLRNPRFSQEVSRDIYGVDVGDATKAQEQGRIVKEGMVFAARPERVEFNEYDAEGVYEQKVIFNNVSGYSQRLQILPPCTEHFSISMVKYPEGNGDIAPGM